VAGGQLWIMPWVIYATQELFTAYLEDGQLPYPDSALPPGTAQAMQQLRQKITHLLEDDAAAAIRARGSL